MFFPSNAVKMIFGFSKYAVCRAPPPPRHPMVIVSGPAHRPVYPSTQRIIPGNH